MKNKQALVSVIMPVYNGAKWLDDSIQSVLDQKYKNFEFVIINDGSTDESLKILNMYAKHDKRIRVFDNKNIGPGPSLNFGIKQANGEYLCFIDQDDMYLPNYLNDMLKAITTHDVNIVMCYGNFYHDKSHEQTRITYPYYPTGIYDISKIDDKRKYSFIFIPQWTKIIKKEFITKNKIYFGNRQDKVHDLPFHILCLYNAQKIYIVNDILYLHRVHESQITFNMTQGIIAGHHLTAYKEMRRNFKNGKNDDKNFLPFALSILFTKGPLAQRMMVRYYRIIDNPKRYLLNPFRQIRKLFYDAKYHNNHKIIKIFGIKFKKKVSDGILLPSVSNCHNVGKNTYYASNISIANPAETVIGSFVSIGKNVILGHGEHPKNFLSTSPYFHFDILNWKSKDTVCHNEFWNYPPIHIGNDVWIGDNVIVKNGITIGDGAIIGMGAVVTHDVPPYAIVVGVPARVIRYRFDNKTIKKLLALQWWTLPDEILKQCPYDDINKAIKFLEKVSK